MGIDEKAFEKAISHSGCGETTSTPGGLSWMHKFIIAYEAAKSSEQPDECTIEEAFKAGKEVGEIAGKVAVEALENVRYERDKLELAYKQLLTETKRESAHQDELPLPKLPDGAIGWDVYSGSPKRESGDLLEAAKAVVKAFTLKANYFEPIPETTATGSNIEKHDALERLTAIMMRNDIEGGKP